MLYIIFDTLQTSAFIKYRFSSYTGCKSDIWKKVQVNILKEPLIVQKQTLHQQKALDLCYLEPERQACSLKRVL